jgi:CRISPR-associated endonuclease Csn1
LTKENRDNQSAREKAKKKILAEMGNDDPRPGDILKVLLAEESNWECPYTGKAFGMADLIGPSPQFDVEHIIPFSRSLDNSFQNKTLCEIAENRNAKRNRTPFQAYSGSPDKYADILRRVARFRGSAARAKLRRFRMEEIPNDFVDRQLNDTRYMSRLAGDYLGLLYGGQIDSSNKRRVQVSAGRITAFLRDEWGLDAILAGGQARDAIPPSPDDRRKNRADHRHHAVDAAVIGLVDPGTVQLLSRAAERAEEMGRRLFARVDRPWQGFEERVRAAIDSINVSYRVDRRVTGPLHDATFYSEPHVELDENGKPVEYRYVRKRLEDLTESMIEVIMDPKVKGVDPKVKGLVKAKLEQCGGDLKKAFADRNDHPYFRTRDGRVIGIHKVRVRERLTTITLGTPGHERHVAPGTNHHVEILEETDAKGRKRWVDELVSLFEAARRVRCGEPVVRRNHGEGRQFVFSLAKDEYVEMDWEGARSLFRVVSVSKGDIEFHLHTDARPTIVKGRKRIRVRSPSSLLKANARKVTVDPLGNVLPAND